jgi:hypothetical protein
MFGWFKKKQADPLPVEIHEADRDLVTSTDIDWFETLTPDDVRSLLQVDDVARMAHFLGKKEAGMSEDAAAASVRKSSLYYYLTIKGRDKEPDCFQDEDARLPFCVKDRVNSLCLARLTHELMESSTSMNAVARAFLRSDP